MLPETTYHLPLLTDQSETWDSELETQIPSAI
jgi:hypothetical protein